MKNLFFSMIFFTTISLMTSCGEKKNENATDEATKECCDSTKECATDATTEVVK